MLTGIALPVIAARPDLLRRDTDRCRQQLLDRRPGLFQRLASGRRMIAVRHGQSGEIVTTLLESGEHVGRMPVRSVAALIAVACFQGVSLGNTKVSGRSPQRAKLAKTLSQQCRDCEW